MNDTLFARRTALAFALLITGCSDPAPMPSDGGVDAGPHGCTTGFVGDGTKEPEIVITVLGPGTTLTEVAEGGAVPLIFPPQGGRVIFAGARARNLEACGATVTGALRDPTTKQVRLDARTVNLVPAGDGWVETDPTDISSFSNVPVCPNQWSMTDLYGAAYELEITIADRSGRTVTKKVSVKPACAEPESEAECLCICKGGYVLGESCTTSDGGADDAGDAGAGDASVDDAGDGG
ncbi:Hypothetical protein A7982_08970 [Minicystis rosea]|nr:Hypothetical protein A7982_08970 [Minicystis rosea]